MPKRLTESQVRGRLHLAKWLESQDAPHLEDSAAAREYMEEGYRAAAWIRQRILRSAIACAVLQEEIVSGS